MAAYFILTTSDNNVTKKFRVILNGYSRILDKKQSINTTLNGQLDVSSGSIQERFMLSVKVRHTEPEDGFGSIGDLETFYRLNNPGATPSNVIKFTNHYGTDLNVIMAGEFNSQLLGIMIEGNDAWFIVNCVFMNTG